jgi:pSer/pThr/pTyr-binding forkhead associated (FHA) protein
MQLRLRVIGGKSDGQEIEIKASEFCIGRGEDVQLRPKSDLISRRHCVLGARDGKAYCKDLDSRNGTFINGEQIKGEVQLKVGDVLRVGRLQFEILIDHSTPASKKPPVESVREAVARTAAASSEKDGSDVEGSITDWLNEASETESPIQQTISETRQFRLDDTRGIPEGDTDSVSSSGDKTDKGSGDTLVASNSDTESKTLSGVSDGKKAKPGKLPDRPKFSSADSKGAASDMLKKFFNRR